MLPQHKRELILSLLTEGNSLRGTARIAHVSYNTVLKFVPTIGAACDYYQNRVFQNLLCRRVEVDEIWSFCHTKRAHLTPEKEQSPEFGDIWTFVAIDPDTKLVISWMVGKRTLDVARVFIADLHKRLAGRTQLTTDGFKSYLLAVDESFKRDIDFAMIVKNYHEGADPENIKLSEDAGVQIHAIIGQPDADHISTSAVERQNLTMRQSMRRFTRRTNGHSKKVLNHAYAIALHFLHYNFARIHGTLKVTPAMAAGLADHVWELHEILALADT